MRFVAEGRLGLLGPTYVFGQAALPIMSENKKASKFFLQAEKLRQQRKFQEAITKYDRAIQKDSSFAEAYLQAAACFSILQEKPL